MGLPLTIRTSRRILRERTHSPGKDESAADLETCANSPGNGYQTQRKAGVEKIGDQSCGVGEHGGVEKGDTDRRDPHGATEIVSKAVHVRVE